jgi:preprotein translocase subunit SecE
VERQVMAKTGPVKFLSEVRQEVSKVVPPTWNETFVTTIMVFIFATLMAIFFYAVDGVISWLLQTFLELLR